MRWIECVLKSLVVICLPAFIVQEGWGAVLAQEDEPDVGAVAAEEGGAPEEQAVRDSLEGMWIAIKSEQGGKSLKQPAVPCIVFEEDRFEITEGKETLRGEYRIDPKTDPKQMVLVGSDGRKILSWGYDRTVRLWDVETGKELRRFPGHRDWVWSVAFARDGRHALSAGGGRGSGGKMLAGEDFAIRLWDVALATGEKTEAGSRPGGQD